MARTCKHVQAYLTDIGAHGSASTSVSTEEAGLKKRDAKGIEKAKIKEEKKGGDIDSDEEEVK